MLNQLSLPSGQNIVDHYEIKYNEYMEYLKKYKDNEEVKIINEKINKIENNINISEKELNRIKNIDIEELMDKVLEEERDRIKSSLDNSISELNNNMLNTTEIMRIRLKELKSNRENIHKLITYEDIEADYAKEIELMNKKLENIENLLISIYGEENYKYLENNYIYEDLDIKEDDVVKINGKADFLNKKISEYYNVDKSIYELVVEGLISIFEGKNPLITIFFIFIFTYIFFYTSVGISLCYVLITITLYYTVMYIKNGYILSDILDLYYKLNKGSKLFSNKYFQDIDLKLINLRNSKTNKLSKEIKSIEEILMEQNNALDKDIQKLKDNTEKELLSAKNHQRELALKNKDENIYQINSEKQVYFDKINDLREEIKNIEKKRELIFKDLLAKKEELNNLILAIYFCMNPKHPSVEKLSSENKYFLEQYKDSYNLIFPKKYIYNIADVNDVKELITFDHNLKSKVFLTWGELLDTNEDDLLALSEISKQEARDLFNKFSLNINAFSSPLIYCMNFIDDYSNNTNFSMAYKIAKQLEETNVVKKNSILGYYYINNNVEKDHNEEKYISYLEHLLYTRNNIFKNTRKETLEDINETQGVKIPYNVNFLCSITSKIINDSNFLTLLNDGQKWGIIFYLFLDITPLMLDNVDEAVKRDSILKIRAILDIYERSRGKSEAIDIYLYRKNKEEGNLNFLQSLVDRQDILKTLKLVINPDNEEFQENNAEGY
ncbi:MAG: hypothetical protein PHW82_16815 [Bacteroidales bacterium]|nr:hypothetical protein [Bacteroidales bacterium]